MGFISDRNIGNIAEDYVRKTLTDAGFVLDDDDGGLDYDVRGRYGRRKYSFEVKYDVYERKSGNIAIEFFNPRKEADSGIKATKADYWIHVLHPLKAWIINTDKLRRFIKRNRPARIIECGGDSNASLYLYPNTILEQAFTKLEEFDWRSL